MALPHRHYWLIRGSSVMFAPTFTLLIFTHIQVAGYYWTCEQFSLNTVHVTSLMNVFDIRSNLCVI